MANIAVVLTDMGQPALLYLVPCTLGLLLFIAHHDNTLPDLWRGPAILDEDTDPKHSDDGQVQ